MKRSQNGFGYVKTYYTTPYANDEITFAHTGVMGFLKTGSLAGLILMRDNLDWNWGREYRREVRNEAGLIMDLVITEYDFSEVKNSAQVYRNTTNFPFHRSYMPSPEL